jgi:hypothetical protein
MDGRVTYADEDSFGTHRFIDWTLNNDNRIFINLDTAGALTGRVTITQRALAVSDFATPPSELTQGVLVPYNFASRHGSTFVQLGLNGASGSADTTPVALPNLSATDLDLGFDYNGTIRTFRMWGQDIQNSGLVEATS